MYFNQYGLHVPTGTCHYRMLASWIDTDNECWEEPAASGVGCAVRANGTGWLIANPHTEYKDA